MLGVESRQRTGRTWILALGWLLLAPAGLVAQKTPARSADLIPSLVTVRVTLPSGETFQATAWEGDALTFRSDRLGAHLALVPTVRNRFTGDVSVTLYPLEDHGSVARITGAAERIDARLGFRSIATSLLDVEVVEIRDPTLREARGVPDAQRGEGRPGRRDRRRRGRLLRRVWRERVLRLRGDRELRRLLRRLLCPGEVDVVAHGRAEGGRGGRGRRRAASLVSGLISWGASDEKESVLKSLRLAFLALVVISVPAVAQQGASDGAGGVRLRAERGSHATIELSNATRSGFLLFGTLRDGAGQPVPGAGIRIVRFEVTGPSGHLDNVADLVPLEQLNAQISPFVVKRTVALATDEDGRFSVRRALPPGRYSLQVDWDDVPEGSPVVQWQLRWEDRGDGVAPKR